MPGITGIISDRRTDNTALHKCMMENLDHFQYKKDSVSKEGVHFGIVHLGFLHKKEPFLFSADKRYLLSFMGEIFSYKSIETEQIEDDQEFFLQHFLTDGLDCLKYINGHYTAALYDFAKETLYLFSDRMGTRPIYYALFNNTFLFAPEVKAILKTDIPREIDYSSVSDLFSFGHLFGHKTMFNGISQLPEASYLVFSKNKLSINKYWDIPEYPDAYRKFSPDKKTTNNTIEEFTEIFSNAMRRNFAKNSNKILFSLSGGLDSRYVVAFAKKIGVDPLISFTMGPDNSEDQIYSKQVAQKLGIQHNPFEINPQNIWKDSQRFGYYSDYMTLIYGPIAGFEALESFFGKTEIIVASQMCDAIFGGNLYRKRLQTLIDKNSFDDEAKLIVTDIYKLFDDRSLQLIFTKDFFHKINGKYKEVPQQYINSTKVPIHAYINILLNEHGRRGTLSGNFMNNLFMETRMPSYDNEVIEFAYKLPLKLRDHQYVYRKAFVKLFPDLAKIRRERYHIPVDASNMRYEISVNVNKVATLLKNSKLKPLLSLAPDYNRPTYVNWDEWFKKELYQQMVDVVLDKKTLSRGIFNEEGLKQIISQHLIYPNNHSKLLWQVINLEYFYRNFID